MVEIRSDSQECAVKVEEVPELTEAQKQAIRKLWNQEYPGQLQHADLHEFDSYLNMLIPKRHFILSSDSVICGWLFVFEREGENWFAMILDSTVQGRGYGSKLLKVAKNFENSLSGWVIDHNNDLKSNGEVYRSPLDFYVKNDFVVDRQVRLETDTISAVKIFWQKQ